MNEMITPEAFNVSGEYSLKVIVKLSNQKYCHMNKCDEVQA